MPDAHINRTVFVERHKDKFEAWLTARGAEVLSPTNEWEMCRFRTDRGTSVVYARKRGDLTWVGESGSAFDAYLRNGRWRGTDVSPRNRKSSPDCQFLRERDGDNCFYCYLPVEVHEESVEHLVARTHGGPDHVANMALAHRRCNQQAGHMPLMEKIQMREHNLQRLQTLTGQLDPFYREPLAEPVAEGHLLFPPDAAKAVQEIEATTTPPWET